MRAKSLNPKLNHTETNPTPSSSTWRRQLQLGGFGHSLLHRTLLKLSLANYRLLPGGLRTGVVARRSSRACSSPLGSQSSTLGPGAGASSLENSHSTSSSEYRWGRISGSCASTSSHSTSKAGRCPTEGWPPWPSAESNGRSRSAAADRPWRYSHL